MRAAIYDLQTGRILSIITAPAATVLLNADGISRGVIQSAVATPNGHRVDVTASPHVVVEQPVAAEAISESDLRRMRRRYEDLPVLIDGVEWDADERSMRRLSALALVPAAGGRQIGVRDARNASRDMTPAQVQVLIAAINEALGERFLRVAQEYNAIKAEIEGGATVTAEQAAQRMGALA